MDPGEKVQADDCLYVCVCVLRELGIILIWLIDSDYQLFFLRIQ